MSTQRLLRATRSYTFWVSLPKLLLVPLVEASVPGDAAFVDRDALVLRFDALLMDVSVLAPPILEEPEVEALKCEERRSWWRLI